MKVKGKTQNVQAVILACLGVAGILTLAAIAPNAVQLLRYLPGVNRSKKNYYINSTINRLKSKGLIEFTTRNDKTFARLTSAGKQKLKLYQLNEIEIKKPKYWDERWRVVIFDIKEMRRRARNQLRNQLMQFNFQRLQQSVWVSPYECEELIFMVKTAFGLGKEVVYMTVEKIENDKWLRQLFNLG
ncbi:MAG: CRISPR-associated endonuclease Cas2 [Candidatus Vogelbacteria bacterium]